MIRTYNVGYIYFQWWEWLAIPLLILGIYLIGNSIASKHKNDIRYRYLKTGLLLKMFGGIFFGAIYIFYYGGGDTTSYYSSAIPLVNLFYEDPAAYFKAMFSSPDIEMYGSSASNYYNSLYFNSKTGFPLSYIMGDSKTFIVSKMTSLLMIPLGNSYFATTVVLSALTYIPLWKLYLTLSQEFNLQTKNFAYYILLIPSVLFWGSGIMKDTFTFSATCVAVFTFYRIVKRQSLWQNVIYFLIACYVIILIKPYVLNVLIPTLGLWIFMVIIKGIKNSLVRFVVLPIVFVGALGGSYFVLKSLGSSMDKFSLDNAVKTTLITQDDLSRENQYGGNYFDIGELDGSIPNMLSKFPIATSAGLYRPFLIEARSPVMILSALENLALLLMSLFILFKIKLKLIWNIMLRHEILFFFLSFSILFAFMIGITTPNFGALVRFKIPLMPFFVAWLYIVYTFCKSSKKRVI
jgi:hypothetical protein